MTDAAADLRDVLWSGPSLERPGDECFLVAVEPGTDLVALYEGVPGDLRKISVNVDNSKALAKAELVLRGEPATLADTRVVTALAAVLVATFGRQPSGRQISIKPRQKPEDIKL